MRSIDPLLGRNMLNFVIEWLVNDGSVVKSDLGLRGFTPGKSMLHPVFVVSVWEIISCMCSSRFFSVFSSIDGNLSTLKKVFELKSFNQVGIPDKSSVRNLEVFVLLTNVFDFLDTFCQKILDSEDCCVSLHGFLHFKSHLSCRSATISMSDLIQIGNCLLSSVFRELFLSLTWFVFFFHCMCSSSAKDDKI